VGGDKNVNEVGLMKEIQEKLNSLEFNGYKEEAESLLKDIHNKINNLKFSNKSMMDEVNKMKTLYFVKHMIMDASSSYLHMPVENVITWLKILNDEDVLIKRVRMVV
jgi:hypothetical protein